MNNEFKVRKIANSDTLNSRYACEYIHLADDASDTIDLRGKDLSHPHCWVLYGPFSTDAARYYLSYDSVSTTGVDTNPCDSRNAVFHTYHGALDYIDTCQLPSLRLRSQHKKCLSELPGDDWVDADWDTVTVVYNPTEASIDLLSISFTYSIETNECIAGTHDCHANAICTDMPRSSVPEGSNSWSCACDKSHTGDGRLHCINNAATTMEDAVKNRVTSIKDRMDALRAKFEADKQALDDADDALRQRVNDIYNTLNAVDQAFVDTLQGELGDMKADPATGPAWDTDASIDGSLDAIDADIATQTGALNTHITTRIAEFAGARQKAEDYQTQLKAQIVAQNETLYTCKGELEETDDTHVARWESEHAAHVFDANTLEDSIERWKVNENQAIIDIGIEEWKVRNAVWETEFEQTVMASAGTGIQEYEEEIPAIITAWRNTRDVMFGHMSDLEFCCSNPTEFTVEADKTSRVASYSDGFYTAVFPGYYYIRFNVYCDHTSTIGVDLLKNSLLEKGSIFAMDWERSGVDHFSASTVLELKKGDKLNIWLSNADIWNNEMNNDPAGTKKTGESTFMLFLISPTDAYQVIDN